MGPMRKRGESMRKWGYLLGGPEEKGLDIGLGKSSEGEIPIGSAPMRKRKGGVLWGL